MRKSSKTRTTKPSQSQSVRERIENPELHALEQDVVVHGERIQKLLAQVGMGSRREIEDWIRRGIVHVNGRPAELGQRITEYDRLEVNRRQIDLNKHLAVRTQVLLYHKPVGEIVSRRDPEGRPTVFKRIPKLEKGRWITVGRLDINSEGLLMLTNNGELANRLMHPSSALEREYAVRVLGELSEEMAQVLLNGLELEDGFAKFKKIDFSGGEGANKWYHVTVTQGRNRVVRRLMESQGLKVSRLIRIRYGPVMLPTWVKKGHYSELTDKEVARLRKTVDDMRHQP